MTDLVAYLRVSTARQEASGLGLEAQRQAVQQYADMTGGTILDVFVEVESGGKAGRPELARALALCRRRKATLLISRLDRLSRSLSFIAQLMDAGVDIRCADMPEANRITLQIMAVFAEHERQAIRDRTKAALAAARARGVVLGAHGAVLAQKHKEEARAHAELIRPHVVAARAMGYTTLRAVGQYLTLKGVPTSMGGAWHPRTVQAMIQRLGHIG